MSRKTGPPAPDPTPAEVEARLEAARVNPSALASLGEKLAHNNALAWLIQWGLASEWPPPAPEKPPPPPYAPGNPTPQAMADARAAARPEPRLMTTPVDDLTSEEVSWLWPGRIPKGRVTVLLGRQGKGKSTLVSWIAATVSSGAPWPDTYEPNEPGTVLILQAEESASQDLRPRLDAFGYGPGKIHIINGVDRGDGEASPFYLSLDILTLRAEVDRIGDVKLVIIDPLASYIRGISGYNELEVRELLRPLFECAEECGVAVLLVVHPNKDSEKEVLDRVGGSGAFTQMARMSWYFSDDPRDPSRRLLSLMKGNLHGATRTAIAVSYEARSRRLTWHPDPVKLEAQDVDNLLQKAAREAKLKARMGRDPEKARKAEDFLLKLLECGPCSLSAAREKALLLGITFTTLRRAIDALSAEGRGAVERFTLPPEERIWFRLPEGSERPPESPEPGGEAGGG